MIKYIGLPIVLYINNASQLDIKTTKLLLIERFTNQIYEPPINIQCLDNNLLTIDFELSPGVYDYILSDNTQLIDLLKFGCISLTTTCSRLTNQKIIYSRGVIYIRIDFASNLNLFQ